MNVGRCKKVLHFMGREVTGRQKFRMQAVKWAVAKLQGDQTASFCRKVSGCEVTGRYISIPIFHGFLVGPICVSWAECTKIAHRHSLAIFHRRGGVARNFRNENQYPCRTFKKNCAIADYCCYTPMSFRKNGLSAVLCTGIGNCNGCKPSQNNAWIWGDQINFYS